MATLQTVVDRIQQDYLNRSTLQAECVRAVQGAIRHYERQRFPWNETATALACVVGVDHVTVPTDFLIEDSLRISAFGGLTPLTKRPFGDIQDMNMVAVNSVPTHYALRGNNFYLFSPPNSAYPLQCYYIQRLSELTATSMTGTNKWLSAAEDLIVFHAAKLVWANVIRNTDEAMKMYQLEQTALNELSGYTDQRNLGRISPTKF